MREIHRAKGISYAWVAVGGLHLAMGIGYGILGTFGVFVNPLNEEMGWSRTAISGAISIIMFIHLLAAGLWALLAEKWSIRGIIAASGMLFSLGVFLASTADSIWQLYLYWGVIGGVGMGGFVSSLPGLVTRWFDRNRVLALGIGMAGIGVGLAVLPILTERLIALDGWRLGFRVLSFIAMGTFLLVAVVIREPYGAERVEGREHINRSTWRGIPNPRGIRSRFGNRLEMTFPEALRTRGFWFLFGIMVVVGVIIQTLQVHLVPRAEDAGVESSSAATLLMVLGVFSILGKVCGGALGDRFESYWIFTIDMILTVLVMGWLIQSSVLWMFYVFAATYGFVYGSWVPNIAGMTVRLFGSRHMGAISGGTLIGGGVGAVIGPVMAGYVFDTTGSYFIAFAITAGVAIVGAVLGILIKRESAAVSARI